MVASLVSIHERHLDEDHGKNAGGEFLRARKVDEGQCQS